MIYDFDEYISVGARDFSPVLEQNQFLPAKSQSTTIEKLLLFRLTV